MCSAGMTVASFVGLRFGRRFGVVDLYPVVWTAALCGSPVRVGVGGGEVGWLGSEPVYVLVDAGDTVRGVGQ